MNVGVLGSGDVAKTLSTGFLRHRHDVTIGTRTPIKLADWAKQNPKGRMGSFADAAKFGELLVLAVKGTAALDALRAAQATNLAGKPVIDATNPIADEPPTNGVLKFFTNFDESLMEGLQHELGNVRFVQAFNSVSNACMVNPQFSGGKPTMFICGNDEAAKKTVSGVLVQFGWENIEHTWTKTRRPQTNGICERFHQTIQNELYASAFRRKLNHSLDELQADVDTWMEAYNAERTHSVKYCYGKTPLQTFIESATLAYDKQLDRIKPTSEPVTAAA